IGKLGSKVGRELGPEIMEIASDVSHGLSEILNRLADHSEVEWITLIETDLPRQIPLTPGICAVQSFHRQRAPLPTEGGVQSVEAIKHLLVLKYLQATDGEGLQENVHRQLNIRQLQLRPRLGFLLLRNFVQNHAQLVGMDATDTQLEL